MKKFFIIPVILQLITSTLHADEGMWLPMLVGKMNYEDMKSKGFKLSAEDIYSVNSSSLKDAIVQFGRGCTGEIISDQGLLITNHHCGYGVIQALSTIENDYLTNGYWAKNKTEELPAPGLTVTFLIRMDDVTIQVLNGVTDGMVEKERKAIIEKNIAQLKAKAEEGTTYTARIQPFYYGNEYYLFVYETYKDVRFVGAPPSSIGKFGGDTDNWVWPRHTGDFSIFRIYADKDNKPALYSPENIPYKPKRFLPISLKGIKEGDFTMVYGYPGTTQEYLTSHAVELITKVSNPNKINLRGLRLQVMNNYMQHNDTIRLKYASKYANVANAWKKWIGESQGLEKMNVVQKKQELEKNFTQWVSQDPQRKLKYGNLLAAFESVYNELKPLTIAKDFDSEAINSIELFRFASGFSNLITELSKKEADKEKVDQLVKSTRRSIKSFYKDYYHMIDREAFANLLKQYYEIVPKKFQPDFFEGIIKDYNFNWIEFANETYNQTVFADSMRLLSLLSMADSTSANILKNDNIFRLYIGFTNNYLKKVGDRYQQLNDSLSVLYRQYMKGQLEMQPEKLFYPDANSTLRVAYGKVSGFEPRDAVEYSYFTTLEGIMEKENPRIYDYQVPARLKELYRLKDYGQYSVDGSIPVAFIATNHTSGGNSGSPVLDSYGNLIGVNFDRCWEGTMSDVYFDQTLCRNISLDIRYALFIIDKFAGAGYLINEMKIIK